MAVYNLQVTLTDIHSPSNTDGTATAVNKLLQNNFFNPKTSSKTDKKFNNFQLRNRSYSTDW
jgi:hypothetical protein